MEKFPLRYYVANNSNLIFDFKGIFDVVEFVDYVTYPLLRKINNRNILNVVTDNISINEIINLGNSNEVDDITKVIENNHNYLNEIPKRRHPRVPSSIATKFMFGHCNVFAQTMFELKNYKPIAIIATKYNDCFSNSKLGYVHSIVVNDIGEYIDIWGIDSLENILKRYEIAEYYLSYEEHIEINQQLKNNSKDIYDVIYKESTDIIKKYFKSFIKRYINNICYINYDF